MAGPAVGVVGGVVLVDGGAGVLVVVAELVLDVVDGGAAVEDAGGVAPPPVQPVTATIATIPTSRSPPTRRTGRVRCGVTAVIGFPCVHDTTATSHDRAAKQDRATAFIHNFLCRNRFRPVSPVSHVTRHCLEPVGNLLLHFVVPTEIAAGTQVEFWS
ncbi:hypothetical protein GCM10023258_32210 [Terrabacter aeriphilus]|uniref:Secreted protein n=1 Tax=Terrabacter aeriphilus TaxID=515662 RepID=A0ABP9JIK2_9MICO